MISPTAASALLLRRAGFGGTSGEVAAATVQGFSATVDQLIGGLGVPDPAADAIPLPTLTRPPAPHASLIRDPAAMKALNKTLATEHEQLVTWWLARMVATSHPLAEKLTFLLHGHFPTAISKVRFPLYLYRQNQIFRTQGSGDFDALTQQIATDPAMLIWLDAASNRASNPNENFARELMERFTLGVGNYTEADVRAGAYCFTGWRVDGETDAFTIDQGEHSTTPQTFLGTRGVTTGQQVIDLVTHSEASSRFVPAAFWSHLAYPVTTSDPVVIELSTGYAANRTMSSLLRAIFEHPMFTSSHTATGLIKQPTEYVVGALRALGFTATDVGNARVPFASTLVAMGQSLFDPPSVGGWSANQYWLSTAAALARWKFAGRLAAVADLSPIADVPPTSRVDAAAALLSVPTWSSTTAAALHDASSDPRELVTLALVSPDYVSN